MWENFISNLRHEAISKVVKWLKESGSALQRNERCRTTESAIVLMTLCPTPLPSNFNFVPHLKFNYRPEELLYVTENLP